MHCLREAENEMSIHPKPKQGQVKLKGKAYHDLRVKVIERDGCRCRNPLCGVADSDPPYPSLTLEHKIQRSHLRLDTEENLVTLCATCNLRIKAKYLFIEWRENIPLAVWEREGHLKPWKRVY